MLGLIGVVTGFGGEIVSRALKCRRALLSGSALGNCCRVTSSRHMFVWLQRRPSNGLCTQIEIRKIIYKNYLFNINITISGVS